MYLSKHSKASIQKQIHGEIINNGGLVEVMNGKINGGMTKK
ncbi:hypothetical protein [Halalkalibacter krulwichiae]|nr:hypothetical protein [Halalkalibacter krulwichiae]